MTDYESSLPQPFSQEAEQAVLGAMLIKPELIDILSADLKESDFFFADNRAIFKGITALNGRGQPVDFLTVGEYIGALPDGTPAYAYAAELHKNTPSAANAKSYAGTVLARSVDRELASIAQNIHEIAYGEGSAEDKIAQAQAQVMAIQSESSAPETISAGAILQTHIEELERRQSLDGKVDGLSTGIASLDKKIMGLKDGALYIVAGRPKMGKTTFAMNIADNVAVVQRESVLVYSLEMTKAQIMDKSLSSLGGIPMDLLKSGSALESHAKEIVDTSAKIVDAPLSVYARKSATISQIRSVARRFAQKHKQATGKRLRLLIVDHIGLVDDDDPRASAVQRISNITRGLKLLAQELECPVIALSQLNRELEKRENKRPIPSDLRDSGSIEQDADAIFFVYRDEVYHPNTEFRGVAEIICAAARDFPAFTQKVRYQGKYSSFSDLSADYEPPEPVKARTYASSSLLD